MVAGTFLPLGVRNGASRENLKLTPLVGKEILVVDDSPEIVNLVRDVFTSCGARVTSATCVTDAIALVSRQRFDLLVQDVSMPGLDGWDMLEYVRLCAPELVGRVLLLTARRYDDGIVAAIHRGKVPCLFKPCAIRDLRAAACTMLSMTDPAWAA